MGKLVFDLVKYKKYLFLSFSLFLALKISKKAFSSGAAYKKFFFLPHLGYNSQHFVRPCAKLKSHISKRYLGIGAL